MMSNQARRSIAFGRGGEGEQAPGLFGGAKEGVSSTERGRQGTRRRAEEALGAASRAATDEEREGGMRVEGTKGRRCKASLALHSSQLYRRQVIRQVFGGRKDSSSLRELGGRRKDSVGRTVSRLREKCPKAVAGGKSEKTRKSQSLLTKSKSSCEQVSKEGNGREGERAIARKMASGGLRIRWRPCRAEFES